MSRSSLFVSLLLVAWLISSCSPRLSKQTDLIPAAIETPTGNESQRYNIQLDFMKHHLSGMLIVRRLPDNEIRILASTYFGLSLFDFSLRGDTFYINSCIEPMRKEKVLKLLEMDFKHLFLNGKDIRIKESSNNFEKRISGKGFGKSILLLSGETKGNPTQVKIKHPLIRLTIRLDKLETNTKHP